MQGRRRRRGARGCPPGRRAAEVGGYGWAMDGDPFGPLDFDRFHLELLPSRLAASGPVFSDGGAGALRPIAFQLADGRAYTYVPHGHSFSVVPGSEGAATVVELDEADWCDFAWELKTCFALFYADRLTIGRGSWNQLVRWEPPLRVAFSGQELYDLSAPPPLTDAAGFALDLSRSFSLGDPDAEIGAFLHGAGFAHLRGVLEPDEVEAISSEVDAAIAAARPDDQRSWWTTVDGTEVCHRVNYINQRSALVAGLGDDRRFRRIGALGSPELRDARDRLDGNGVVVKVPGASEGLADLPWHRDCGMGGHPVKCPMLNIGIQLDPATPETGQLQMIAGSHRGTSELPGADEAAHLPVAALTTEPGDVTVHFGHTLHAAPPPTDRAARGRRALYLSFVPPRTFEMVGPGQGYNDVLFTRDSGRIHHPDELR